MTSPSRPKNLLMRLLLIVSYAFVILIAAILGSDDWITHDRLSDAGLDRLTAQAAMDGFGANRTSLELAARQGLDLGWERLHPRPPAALLLQIPHALVPSPYLFTYTAALTAGAVLALSWATARLIGRGAAMGLLIAMPLLYFVAWPAGNVWRIVPGAMVAIAWVIKDRPWVSGTLIGVAAAAKIWPLFVLAAIWRIDRRIAYTGLLSGTTVTLLGLLLPGVSVTGTIETLTEASKWVGTYGNFTIAAALALFNVPIPHLLGPAFGVTAMMLLWRRVDPDRLVAWSIVVGLASSTIAWPTYWYAAVPVVASLLIREPNNFVSDTRPAPTQ